MARGIQRALRRVLARVEEDIRGHAERGGHFAKGLAGEGYAGGYAQALMDVDVALNGIMPTTRYWREEE